MMLGVRDGDCDRLGVRVRLGEPEADSVPEVLGVALPDGDPLCVRDGDTEMVADCEGDTLGVLDRLGVTLGVPERLGVLLPVDEMLGVLLGVRDSLGVSDGLCD